MGNKSKSLISIERVVSFVLGPVIAAGAGWLSLFLAKEAGIAVSSEAIVGVFSAGTLGATTLIYKWLDGRAKHTLLAAEKAVSTVMTDVGVSPEQQAGIVHVAADDLQKFAQDIVGKTVGVIHTAEQNLGGVPVQDPSPVIPATHDPAPSTPVSPPPAATPQPAPVPQQSVAPAVSEDVPADIGPIDPGQPQA